MDRRSFLQGVCVGTAGIMVGGLLVDLADAKTIKAVSRMSPLHAYREIPVNLQDTPELQPVGGWYHLQIDDLDKDILIAHVTPSKYYAVDIKCPHKGCDVAYNKDNKDFACPCHGSAFDLNGVVQNGPATRNLVSYHVSLTDTEVIIQVPVEGEAPPPGDSTKLNPTAPVADSSKPK